jgi:hypothetical protein
MRVSVPANWSTAGKPVNLLASKGVDDCALAEETREHSGNILRPLSSLGESSQNFSCLSSTNTFTVSRLTPSAFIASAVA